MRNEYAMIDSTIVGAHQHSAGTQKDGEDRAIGRSKGGLSTKIHAMVKIVRLVRERRFGRRQRRIMRLRTIRTDFQT